jgi:hypothetical protein
MKGRVRHQGQLLEALWVCQCSSTLRCTCLAWSGCRMCVPVVGKWAALSKYASWALFKLHAALVWGLGV